MKIKKIAVLAMLLATAAFACGCTGAKGVFGAGAGTAAVNAGGPGAAEAPGKQGKTLKLKETGIDANAAAGISVMPLGIFMTVTDYDAESGRINAVISNESGHDLGYGEDFWLEEKTSGEWVRVEPKEEYSWIEVWHELKDLESAEVSYNLSYFGELHAGDYRLCKTDLYAEFTLVEK
ncbi:MAG: hypothetical protein Q4E57_08130 [Eubacteriales bacterium]|nr:hypothetical protein [Eubacteriales bacterium]